MTEFSDYVPHITQELIDRGHARRMSILEDYFAVMERQRLYKNFNLYGQFNQPFTKTQLATALRPILLKYPILATAIIPKQFPDYEPFYTSKKYYDRPYPICDYIKPAQKVTLQDILLNEQVEHKDTVDTILTKFIEYDYQYTGEVVELIGSFFFPEFDGSTPNWRILCLPLPGEKDTGKYSQLVFISNHCLSDGISAVNFLQDLAKAMANARPSKDTNDTPLTIIDYSQDYKDMAKLPPPITKYVEHRSSLVDLLKLVMSNFVKNHLTYKSDAEITARLLPLNPQRYHILLNFNPAQISSLKEVVKRNVHRTCTITPFLEACFLVALHRYGKIFRKNWTEWGFDVAVAINTRKFLPEDDELKDIYKYGSSIGGFHYTHLISSFDIEYNEKEKFWKLVEYYFGLLSNHHDALVGLGILMSDQVCQSQNIDNMLCNDYLNQKRGGLLLSNVGYHPQNTDSSPHIRDLVFSQTAGALKFTFGMNAIATNGNGLNIDLNIAKSAISGKDEWLVFCREFESVVRNFTEST
ncbi:hypothetical protein HG535_0A03710 [Zygotorulaspora mrakii]|uniref:Alcohol acetyltransferase n=1 Tax=Zygotorulaspora mrakii TaxID=42260 RepID=A0A7H9AXY1_ZYGMR|nr:uncharacterized protein HG535_0A03710 [Zygotorulaspora mrakii]QLG70432.1 hypothetical protein HG535_0A03710 [Zygotorulaspora mrakii]